MTVGGPDAAAIAEESLRLQQLRMVVDLTTAVLRQGRLDRGEARSLVAAARHRILELFPDKESTYELILAPRFARLIREFSRSRAEHSTGRVLPFRP